jgi:hypothetical protein
MMTNAKPEIETCILRVETPTGHPQGTGFILTSTLAVTCAHVVDACGAGPGGTVRLVFQAGSAPVEAEVLADGWHEEADVAFLRLLSLLPSTVTPAILEPSTNTDSHTFRALGYPNVGDFQGVWAEGKILGLTTDSQGRRALQLESRNIAPGTSGAPVLDTNTGRVVGMVNLTYNADATLKFRDAAFAIPSETLRDLCPVALELQPVWDTQLFPKSSKKQRRVDAAAPSHAELNQSIYLRVQVRFPDSPLLGIEDWPTKQKPTSVEQSSEPVALEFLVDPQTGKLEPAHLEIRVVAPDFRIEGVARQIVEVPPDQYSKCIPFLLTAMRAGICRINVEVYNVDHIYLGTIPVEVETTSDGVAIPPTAIVTNLFLVVMVERDRIVHGDKVSGDQTTTTHIAQATEGGTAIVQQAGGHSIQIGQARDVTIHQETLLRDHLTLTGDGNVVGNDNTVRVTKQQAGDYAIQIGEFHLTISADELHRILKKDIEPRQQNLPILCIIALVVITAIVAIVALRTPQSDRPLATITPTCPITTPTDEETFEEIKALIEQGETYAWSLDRQGRTSEALDLINDIFFPDAYISSHDLGLDWHNPIDHYSEKFSAIDVFDVTYDWDNLKIIWSESREQACLSLTAIEGKWEDKDGLHYIENDHTVWYFRQDDLGCWRIAKFFYNDYEPPYVACE